MSDNITIILSAKDWQQDLTFKGEVTHIQCDELIDSFGKKHKRLQLFVKDVSGLDIYKRDWKLGKSEQKKEATK